MPIIPRNIRVKFKKPIKLYWWRDHALGPNGNFGDEITKLIIENIIGKNVVWAEPWDCDMIGAGSLLSDVFKRKKYNKPIVWTSGFLEDDKLLLSDTDFHFKGVRGQLSNSRITSNNKIVLGDAGLLAIRLITSSVTKKYKLGIIPHYVDYESPRINNIVKSNDILIINPTDDTLDVINRVAECENILSSSLHGLIVSDSLGVPNRHLVLSDKVRGNGYKFRDYYSIYESQRYNPLSLDPTLLYSTDRLVEYVQETFVQPLNVEDTQNNIINAFPF